MADAYGFDAILKRMLSLVPDTVDKREGSIIYDALAPTAHALAAQNYMLAGLSDLLFGDTAEGEWLDRVVNDFGITRESATQAVRQIDCTDSEGAAFTVPVGARFAINELTFCITEEITPGSYKAVCEQEGSAGNSYSGAVLPVDNISGLGAAVLSAQPLISARDTETDDDLRARFYASVRETPFGGNRADYREKALSIDGVGACVVFAASDGMGAGNVGLMIGDEQGNCASETLIAKVQELFGTDGDGLAPVGHTVYVATGVETAIAVDAQLTLKSGVSIELVAPFAEAAAESYINGLAFDAPTVFYAKLVSEILNSHEAILDAQVTLNGGEQNIALEKSFECYQIPAAGEINISGAVG